MKAIQEEKAWEDVMEMLRNDEVFDAEVTGIRTGAEGKLAGATVTFLGLNGFLPGSHMLGGVPAVGQKLECKLLDVDQHAPMGPRLVVSNRLGVMKKYMSSLKQGEIMKGTVTDVKPYGVFVSLDEAGGINGLLHISAVSG